MRLNDGIADFQSQTEPIGLCGMEGLENPIDRIGETTAVVADRETDAVFLAGTGEN